MEIKRFYGLYQVWEKGILLETFITLYSAKEYIANFSKVGA